MANIENMRTAVLLMDLQRDFLGEAGARMPVLRSDAANVLAVANDILDGKVLAGAFRVLVLNAFPASDYLANFIRHGAAIAGTPGAELDTGVRAKPDAIRLEKSRPSAFTNPKLLSHLRERNVTTLYVIGVFAEACVRATAIDGVRHGFRVLVPMNAIGTDSELKRRFAHWAMRRAGVLLIDHIV